MVSHAHLLAILGSTILCLAGCSQSPSQPGSAQNFRETGESVDGSLTSSARSVDDRPNSSTTTGGKPIRFATFNVSLHRRYAGDLITELKSGDCQQARQVAAILQRVRPDVLLVNELDHDEQGTAARLFDEFYLRVGQNGQNPLDFPYHYTGPVNTGVSSGFDLNQNGVSNEAADAFGFGHFPGQYGLVVYSIYPIDYERLRTFQKFLWKDMPDARWPHSPETGQPYYDANVREVLRLSSKSHEDVPVMVNGRTIHFLVCHPTPPVFDGPEDRNGHRNHDEIRLLADYIDPQRAFYLYDDRGRTGGLEHGADFIVAGDMNADPLDGDSLDGAIGQLLEHPLVRDTAPISTGAAQQSRRQALANLDHRSDPAHDTADFSDEQSGNLRVDYVLPSRTLRVVNSGVFWPPAAEDGHQWLQCSDHRLVWVDVRLAP